ncbi:MarR family winged helix-turn-helix transcriptional regulator [Streptomyces avicenniae]|uniref:MarR family winged helix-turn-helix transcriptional regulator n=1 Tax=Streptomyces avicenniae TaxID=500153 RepID=UPI00069B312C|nr:MarR family transcriptional regulator [Streptomyces avicenniae]
MTGPQDTADVPPPPDTVETAHRLGVAITRLRSRLREESGTHDTGLSISQLSVLRRVIDEGPVTAAYLAGAEHVSPQSIAQNLAALKEAGLVTARRDPADGRRTLISAHASGDELVRTLRASRVAWLTQALDTLVGPEERPALDAALDLLERLAASDVHNPGRKGSGRKGAAP